MAGWGQNGTGWDIEERVQKVANLVWDTESLSWVRSTPSGGGAVSTLSAPRALFDKADANTLYIGKATTDALSTDPVWQIKRIIFNASGFPESICYASSGMFNNTWDQRESLSYVSG